MSDPTTGGGNKEEEESTWLGNEMPDFSQLGPSDFRRILMFNFNSSTAEPGMASFARHLTTDLGPPTDSDESRPRPAHSVATWNVGGINTGWAEFVTEPLLPLYNAVLDQIDDPDSPHNTLEAMACFRGPRCRLVAELEKAGFDSATISDTVATWMAGHEGSIVAALALEGGDPERKYSWGDRHLGSRPTPLSSAEHLDPALFRRTSCPDGVPHYRRFVNAWIDHVFERKPDGTLLRPIPPNKYQIKLLFGETTQILSYLNLFFFDWAAVFFLDHARAGGVMWPTVRAQILAGQTPDTKRARTTKILADLCAKCDVVGVQELTMDQIRDMTLPKNAELVLSGADGVQRCGVLVRDRTRIVCRDVFAPEPLVEEMRARIAGVTVTSPDSAKPNLYVSVHLCPDTVPDLETVLLTIGWAATTHSVSRVYVMGDFNIHRSGLAEFGKTCRANLFQTTWAACAGVPDTVSKRRTKWLQPQLAKGGIADTNPKDHILVWSCQNGYERSETAVCVSDAFACYEPEDGPLVLDLPSDHAIVTTRFANRGPDDYAPDSLYDSGSEMGEVD